MTPAALIAALVACVLVACGGGHASGTELPIVDQADEVGQSNSEGRADPTGQLSVDIPHLIPWDAPSLQTPLTPNGVGGLGTWLQTARDLKNYGLNVAMFRHAQGGTPISMWQKGQPFGDQYRAGHFRMRALISQKYPGYLQRRSGVIMLGETDGTSLGTANGYEAAFRQLMNSWDEEFGPMLWIVVLLHSNMSAVTHRAIVRAAQLAVCAERPWRIPVDPDIWLPNEPFADGFHYVTSASVNRLGAAIARAKVMNQNVLPLAA